MNQGKYIKLHNGDEFEIELGKIHKERCCDCGLVHNTVYRLRGKRVFFYAWRNERATSQIRRWRK